MTSEKKFLVGAQASIVIIVLLEIVLAIWHNHTPVNTDFQIIIAMLLLPFLISSISLTAGIKYRNTVLIYVWVFIVHIIGPFFLVLIYICIIGLLTPFIDINWFVYLIIAIQMAIKVIFSILIMSEALDVIERIDNGEDAIEDLFSDIEGRIQNPNASFRSTS